MTSNILAGERRWASARRTGMTVLGKVAVPKPLNLPSQKLENHGIDPNVEIVPKGSIGWGSRHSSSGSNPWGSSTVEGSSPLHPSGRPSSSGSRPSTGGSEKTHDHGGGGGNAWGLSSRPSSASGISASNQTSLTSSRPHSADTRPVSSQISRFAEQHADSVVAHHPAVSSERPGLASSSDKEKFSLSSGDFPTLNAVADKSSGSRDQGSHSRPSSASGEVAKKENLDISQPDVDNGTVNAWKREGLRNSDEMHPSMVDKWHGEPPQYHNNANVPPPHFDGWRGPSMNHPGVWYQGIPPGGPPPPYGPPPPGGFPVEQPPYSFYCPRVPPSQRPGPMGHHHHHPNNGEIYRPPPMPDAFVRPGMPPYRPGYYHGPPHMPTFEGYYGPPPPMGYCNPNEHEVPFNPMPHGPPPPSYNRYPPRDNDPSFNDSTPTTTHNNRTGKPSHFHDVPEQQHHVILKHHNDDVINLGGKQNYPNPNKRSQQPGIASRTKEWGAEDDCSSNNEDDMYSSTRAPHEFHSSSGGSDSITIRSGGGPYGSVDNNVAACDNVQLKKVEKAGDGILPSSAIPRGVPTLIQKIDGLNEKARASDFRKEGSLPPSQWAEPKARNEGSHQWAEQKGQHEGAHQWAEQKGRNEASHPHSQWAEHKGRNEGSHPSQWAEQKGRNEGSHPPSQWGEQKSRNEGSHPPSQWGEQKGRNEGSHPPSQWAEHKGRNEGSHPPSQWAEQKGRNEGSHPPSQWAEQKGTGAVIGEIIVPFGDKTSHVTTANPRRGGYGVVRGKTGDYNKQKFNSPGDATDGWQNNNVQSQDISSVSDIHEYQTQTTAVAASEVILPEKQEVDNEVVDATTQNADRLKMKEMVKQRALQLQKEEEERTREQKAKALAKLEELNRRNTMMIQKDEKVGPEAHYESSRVGEWGEEEEEPADSDNNVPFETPPVLPNPSKEEPLVVIDGVDRDFVAVPPPLQLNQEEAGTNNKQTGGYNKQKQSGGGSRKNLVTKVARNNNNTELVADSDVGSGNDSKPVSDIVHAGVESSSLTSQQRKRSGNNRNTKNKHNNKSDDLQPPTVVVDESKVAPPRAVSVKMDTTNGDGAQGSGSVNVNHHHYQKPQKSGRFARNQPTARFPDKYHGNNDHVVWAPVQQPQSKTEETGQKAVEESGISVRNDDQMQNNMKSKRAEMERYVPKPVAKELAQQSSTVFQQSDEVAEKVEPESKISVVAENVAQRVVAESWVEDSKHNNNNKQTKAVGGGWRQRGSSSFKPNYPKNQQSSVEERDLSYTNTEEQQSGGFKDPNNVSSDDAKKIQNDPGHQAQGGRYQENNTGRGGKRHALKGERGMRQDNKSHIIQQQDPKMNLAVKSSEDRPSSSHWQPKSGSNSNISGGEAGGPVKKGIIQSLPEEQHHVKEVDSSRADPSVPKGSFPIEGGQRREKKVPYSSKGHSHSHSHSQSQSHAINEDESTFVASDESQATNRRGGGRYHQNARFATNREFRGGDLMNHERHQHEYQPIPGGRNEKNNTEDGNVGPRYNNKERGGGGQQHSRRGRGGQFHGRSNVQVGAGYG